jgi:hypothetical protein
VLPITFDGLAGLTVSIDSKVAVAMLLSRPENTATDGTVAATVLL